MLATSIAALKVTVAHKLRAGGEKQNNMNVRSGAFPDPYDCDKVCGSTAVLARLPTFRHTRAVMVAAAQGDGHSAAAYVIIQAPRHHHINRQHKLHTALLSQLAHYVAGLQSRDSRPKQQGRVERELMQIGPSATNAERGASEDISCCAVECCTVHVWEAHQKGTTAGKWVLPKG